MFSKAFVDVAISQMTTISSQLSLGWDVHSTKSKIKLILDQTLEKPDFGYKRADILSLKERINPTCSQESCSQVVSSAILLFQKHSFFCSLNTFMSRQDAHTIVEAIAPRCTFSEGELCRILSGLQIFSDRERLDICSLLEKIPTSNCNAADFFRFVHNVSDLAGPASRMSIIECFSKIFLPLYTIDQVESLLIKFNNIEDQSERQAVFRLIISNIKPYHKKRLTLFMAYNGLAQREKEVIASWYQKVKPETLSLAGKARTYYNLVVVVASELFVKIDEIFAEQQSSPAFHSVSELFDALCNFQKVEYDDPASLDLKEILQGLDINHPDICSERLEVAAEEKKYEDQVLIDSLVEFFNEGFETFFSDMIPFLQILENEKKLYFLQVISTTRNEFRSSLLREMSVGKDFLNDGTLSSLMFLLIFFPDNCKPAVVKALLEREDFTSVVMQDPLSLVKDFLHYPGNGAFRDEVYDHLIKEIQSHPSASEAQWITSILLSNTESFAIEHGSQLHLLCWSVFIWSKDTTTRKNPYSIYENVIAASKTKSFNTILCPFAELENQYVSLSVDSFKKSLMQGVPLSDVLSHAHGRRYDFSDWSNLISSMLVRIERLSYTSKRRTINDIRLITSSSITTHVDNLNSVVFKNILDEPYRQNVSSVKAMFSSIFTYILDQPDIFESANLLSEREKALLMISESIQNCPVGKIEGIRLVYSLLPEVYKYRQVQENLDVSVQAAQFLVRKFFQQKIDPSF